MAAISIAPGFATRGQEVELRDAAADLPDDWSIKVTKAGEREFKVGLEGGETGGWSTVFFTGQVELTVNWLRGFLSRRDQKDPRPRRRN